MSEPQQPACEHGVPQGAVCPACIAEIIRRTMGLVMAQESGAAPTPLAAGAIQAHEMLLAHMAAGFTRPEAMQIVLTVYAITMFKAPPAQ